MTLLLLVLVVLLALVLVAGALWRRARSRREPPTKEYVESTFIGW